MAAAAETNTRIRAEILSSSCSASGIINELGSSTNLSSELRPSLFPQRFAFTFAAVRSLDADLLTSPHQRSQLPGALPPGSLLIHFLVNKSLAAGALACPLRWGGKARPLTRGSFQFDGLGSPAARSVFAAVSRETWKPAPWLVRP